MFLSPHRSPGEETQASKKLLLLEKPLLFHPKEVGLVAPVTLPSLMPVTMYVPRQGWFLAGLAPVHRTRTDPAPEDMPTSTGPDWDT